MARMTSAQKWIRLCLWLHREFPCDRVVVVRSIPKADYFGITYEAGADGSYYLIRVRSKHCFQLRCDTLIHEWAHAMTWHGPDSYEKHHGPGWGVAYARLYDSLCIWNFGRSEDLSGEIDE